MHARIVQVMLTAVGFIASLSLSTGVHAAVANGLIAYPCETGNPPETHQQNICLIDPAAPNPAATRKQITFDGINALPAWSPDGTMLAYTHLEGNSAEIFVMKISDLSAKPLVPGAAPAWSPDGNRIAFTAPSAIVGGAQEIWAIDLNGANLQQLTKRPAGDVGPGGNSLVTWAPDSQSIAYGYTVQDPNHPVVDKHTTIEVTNLVTNQTIPDLTGPYLCPGVGVCRQNLDAKGNVIPGQFVLDANSPAWSPTGNEIAYAAGLEGSGVQICWCGRPPTASSVPE